MTAFDQLHSGSPTSRCQLVGLATTAASSRREHRPILAGRHAILLAPTAGGKTEAAFLPVLSRMLPENWTGLSVSIFVPIKALLNNLDIRLSGYCNLVGRRSGIWHGDIREARRSGQFLKEPPDCLLTTPESLEVMLVSRRTDKIACSESAGCHCR